MASVFKIRNKETREFWKTPNGKETWIEGRFAKNAFCGWESDDVSNKKYFNEQSLYELVEFILVEKGEYDQIVDNLSKAIKLIDELSGKAK